MHIYICVCVCMCVCVRVCVRGKESSPHISNKSIWKKLNALTKTKVACEFLTVLPLFV